MAVWLHSLECIGFLVRLCPIKTVWYVRFIGVFSDTLFGVDLLRLFRVFALLEGLGDL